MRKVRITRIDTTSGKTELVTDWVAQERPFRLFLNENHFSTIMCSPSNLKELAVGYLLSEGIIESLGEIERIEVKEDICQVRLVASADLNGRLRLDGGVPCSVPCLSGSHFPQGDQGRIPSVRSDLMIKAKTVLDCIDRLDTLGETFRRTGGVHVAAIYRGDGTLVAFAEDVGRHNAVDKAIGGAAFSNAALDGCFLSLSGRLTAEIVRKASRVAIPVVASLAAAVDSGVQAAKETDVTLVGFVRQGRMNVYTSPARILA